MIDESGFGKRLDEAMKKANYTNKKITEELNLSKNLIGNYKENKIPKTEILYNLSQKLGTTMEYLLTGKESYTMSEEEKNLIEAYKKADAGRQESVRTLLNLPEPAGKSSTSTSEKEAM